VREYARDDLIDLLRQLINTLELRAQERLQLWREVDDAVVVVLGGPRIEAEFAGLEVELPALERENLALRPQPKV
jgi:hypothetical protein